MQCTTLKKVVSILNLKYGFIRTIHTTQWLNMRSKPIRSVISTGNPVIDASMQEMDLQKWKYSAAEMRDGFTPYQRDLVREAIIVKSYLLKVKDELPTLLKTFNPIPYTPPSYAQYLRFKYVDHLDDPDHPIRSHVTLFVHMDELVLFERLNPSQVHFMQLVLGKRFNPIKNRLHFSSDRFPFRAQNKRWLIDTFITLLNQVKTNQTDFSTIPIKKDHIRKLATEMKRQDRLKFPKHWLNAPSTAPLPISPTEPIHTASLPTN